MRDDGQLHLTRYYADVIGLTDKQFGVFSMLLPIISAVIVVAGNLFVGQLIDNTRTPAGKARPYLFLSAPVMAVAIVLMLPYRAFLKVLGRRNRPGYLNEGEQA